MKIKRNSLWYNLFMFPSEAYTINDEWNGRTLCSFFWRTVLNLACWAFIAFVVGILLGAIVATLVAKPIPLLIMFVFMASAAKYAHYQANRETRKQDVPPGVFKSMYKAIKGKFCPLITFED